MSLKKLSSRHNRMNTHELKETVAEDMKPAHAQTRQNGRTEIGSGHRVPPLTEKLFVIDNCRERGNLFATMECPWVCQPHTGRLYAQEVVG